MLRGRHGADGDYPVVEQAVFASSSEKLDDANTPTSQATETMRWPEGLENDD